MRIVAPVHFYPPHRFAGSETMLHTMLSALRDAGHEVEVVVAELPDAPAQWTYGGIQVWNEPGWERTQRRVRTMRPDVLVSHHQHALATVFLGKRMRVPSVFIQHNTFGMNKGVIGAGPDLTVFNTEWVAQGWRHMVRTGTWTVVRPPVMASEHATTPGDHVTLVNLNEHKGAHVFYRLARFLPQHKFLGVSGGHGVQIRWGAPPNVTIVDQTANMRDDVWARTRVLIMPSVYESYGMVGVEALASGIPVVATPTPGLREALGESGIFVDRANVARWAATLRTLLNSPAEWSRRSELARRRSTQLDPGPDLAKWVRAVESLVPVQVPAA